MNQEIPKSPIRVSKHFHSDTKFNPETDAAKQRSRPGKFIGKIQPKKPPKINSKPPYPMPEEDDEPEMLRLCKEIHKTQKEIDDTLEKFLDSPLDFICDLFTKKNDIDDAGNVFKKD